MKRILLIQFRPIGDVLLTTPLISVLRKNYPEAYIAFMVEPLPGQMLENNPDLNEILYYRYKKDDIRGSLKFFRETGRKKWDISIDVFGTPGTAWASLFSRAKVRVGYTVRVRKLAYTHRVDHLQPDRYSALKKLALLKAIGINDESPELTLRLTEEEHQFAQSYFEKSSINLNKLTVCFAPGAKRPVRAWITDKWSALGDMLREKIDANIVLIWGPGEEKIVEDVSSGMSQKPYIIPLTNLREMAAVIKRSHLLVSNCTGPIHIAAAVRTPTITLYGSTSPNTWTNPDFSRHRYVQGDVPCIECNLKSCSHLSCMHSIGTDDVLRELENIPELQDKISNMDNS